MCEPKPCNIQSLREKRMYEVRSGVSQPGERRKVQVTTVDFLTCSSNELSLIHYALVA